MLIYKTGKCKMSHPVSVVAVRQCPRTLEMRTYLCRRHRSPQMKPLFLSTATLIARYFGTTLDFRVRGFEPLPEHLPLTYAVIFLGKFVFGECIKGKERQRWRLFPVTSLTKFRFSVRKCWDLRGKSAVFVKCCIQTTAWLQSKAEWKCFQKQSFWRSKSDTGSKCSVRKKCIKLCWFT